MKEKYEELKQALQSGTRLVTFTKKDGTVREMRCTLQPDLLPPQKDLEEAIQEKKVNTEALAVWDLDKEAWRAFRIDAINSVSDVHE